MTKNPTRQRTATTALFWFSMASRVYMEVMATAVERVVSSVRIIVEKSSLNVPMRIYPGTIYATIYPRHMITAAAQQVMRFARYTFTLVCPTISLLRIVPSLYSVPMNRLVKTAKTMPMTTV